MHYNGQQNTSNLLKAKRNLLYIRNQSVPRCKHFPRLFKDQKSVYSAVRTGSLYKADYVCSLSNRGGKCLQRGTDWLLV